MFYLVCRVSQVVIVVVVFVVVADQQVDRNDEQKNVLDPIDGNLEGKVKTLGHREEEGGQRSVEVVKHQAEEGHVVLGEAGRRGQDVDLHAVMESIKHLGLVVKLKWV
jgi:hypothetical protein